MSDREPIYGLHLTDVSEPDELEAIAQIQKRLQMLGEIEASWNRVAKIKTKSNSELALDDQYTAWKNLSHSVYHALNTAVDNLTAFSRLVLADNHIRLPYSAQYPLLRTALEASSQALWLLGPDNPRTRLDRFLRLAAVELEDDTALHRQVLRDAGADLRLARADVAKARKQQAARSEKHLTHLRAVASRLEMSDYTAGRRAVGYAEIVRDATAATGLPGYYGEFMWRIMSGLTHPSLLRAVAHSDIELISDNGDGTLNGLFTSKAELTRTALESGVVNTREAIRLLGIRKIKPADPAVYEPPQEASVG